MIEEEVFVSRTLVPLTKLAEMDFNLGDDFLQEKHSCNSGVCFV